MGSSYFKVRARFDFSPNRYEIGTPIIKSAFVENHFFLRLYSLASSEYEAFYLFHLAHYLKGNPGQEENFFTYVSEITEDRLRYYKRQDPFSSRSKTNESNIRELKDFQQFLFSIDHWKKQQPLELVLEERDHQITVLKEEVAKLQLQLQKLRPYEPSEKIAVSDRQLGTFINLIQQMQALALPDGRKLLRSQGQSSWYKLISKYFEYGGSPIPIETARNYFPAQKDIQLVKGSRIPLQLRLFKIVPSDPEKPGS